MFDNLTDRLQTILQNVKGEGRLSSENVDAALGEIRKSFLEADVSLKVIKAFLHRVRLAAVGEKVVSGITPTQKFIQIVHDELVVLLGSKLAPLKLDSSPAIIMLLGLQGAGKTTTSAKLALQLIKQGKKVLLAALDLQRPAAIDQLVQLGKQNNIEVFFSKNSNDVLEVAQDAVVKANDENFDVLIFDTAGRLQVDNELMAELLLLDRKYKPQEKLLVVDSLIGQESVNVAEAFNTQIGITGAILTKLDGDSRGGAALSIAESTGVKVRYMGLSEKIEPLEEFDPERMASRILGFGDVISLVKKAEEQFDKEESAALEKKLKKGELSFETFLQMQKMISKLGNLSQIFNLMGLNSALQIKKEDREKLFEEGQQKLKLYEFAIQSMTVKERKNPDLVNPSRIRRIAKGSGLKEPQVTLLISEFNQMRGMVKMMSSLGGLKPGSKPSPQELAMMMNKNNKADKQERKKGGGSFGGGAFMKF